MDTTWVTEEFFFFILTEQYNLHTVLSLKYFYWDFEKRKKPKPRTIMLVSNRFILIVISI